ncbi:hypothetical protein D9757_007295 [Collybiopsis confluens]|uniref:Uncharacterized protein n=1 Tax=Collybiopsis confluens TaxID=2823264 RepID=A0A8H5M6A7_9AGAR|nr:hypothetical protein D9757_007295 [Collybiopsis confluens]
MLSLARRAPDYLATIPEQDMLDNPQYCLYPIWEQAEPLDSSMNIDIPQQVDQTLYTDATSESAVDYPANPAILAKAFGWEEPEVIPWNSSNSSVKYPSHLFPVKITPEVFGWREQELNMDPEAGFIRPYAEPIYSKRAIQQVPIRFYVAFVSSDNSKLLTQLEMITHTKSLAFTKADCRRVYSEDLFDYDPIPDSNETSEQCRSFITDPFLEIPTELTQILLFIPALSELYPFGALYNYHEEMLVFRGRFLISLDETYRGNIEQWNCMPYEAKQWISQFPDRRGSDESYLTRYTLTRLPLSSPESVSLEDHPNQDVFISSVWGTGSVGSLSCSDGTATQDSQRTSCTVTTVEIPVIMV